MAASHRRVCVTHLLDKSLRVSLTAVLAIGALTLTAQEPRRDQLVIAAAAAFPGGTVLSISPDGRNVVYRAEVNGVVRLYRQPTDGGAPEPIPGSDGAEQPPAFSPDGRQIAFTIDTAVVRMAIEGGSPEHIADLPQPARGMTWATDDAIFAGVQEGGIVRVPVNDGAVVSVTKPSDGRADWYPQVIPGTPLILFTSSYRVPDAGDLVLLDQRTGTRRIVLRGAVAGRYVAGHIVFVRGNDLWAARFDPVRRSVLGEPTLLERGISVGNAGPAHVALADNGTFAYIPSVGGGPAVRTLVWVTRDGREQPLGAPTGRYSRPRLSPDGRRVAAEAYDRESDIWIWDIERGVSKQLTDTPGNDQFPIWMRDSRRLLFASTRNGPRALFRQVVSGGPVERVVADVLSEGATVTPDGSTVILHAQKARAPGLQEGGGASGDLVAVTLDRNGRTEPVVTTDADDREPDLSPDGHWLAYQSDESGRPEVYATPFRSSVGRRIQISTTGGLAPLWSRDGTALFYRAPDGSVMEVETGANWWQHGMFPRLAVKGQYVTGPGRQYDVSPDKQRFLMLKDVGGARPQPQIVIVRSDAR